jgi:hypothetical protein
MAPIVNSRQLVTIRPVDAAKVEVGDVVLARVAGTVYLHLVSAEPPLRRGQHHRKPARPPPRATIPPFPPASLWGFAIHLASRDGYEDSVLPSGLPIGEPEEALDCASHQPIPDHARTSIRQY